MLHNRKEARKANRQRQELIRTKRRAIEKAAPDLLAACEEVEQVILDLGLPAIVRLAVLSKVKKALAKAKPEVKND